MLLKRVRRQGWVDRGVDDPESVADHSWGVALLAWTLASGREDLNRDRVMLLALVHDLPEALAGDTTPFDVHRDEHGEIDCDRFRSAPSYDAGLRADKQARERAALEDMLSELPADLAEEIRAAWEEYERGESAEARFVKQVDKVETVLQAELYRSEQPDLVMDSFRLGALRDVDDPALLRLLRMVVRESED